MTRYHVEYIVHVYVEADDEDTARTVASQMLVTLDEADELARECEWLAIEADQ